MSRTRNANIPLMSAYRQIVRNCEVLNLSVLVFCRRIRDKYESELNEVERNERQITEKYNRNKVRMVL